MFQPVVKLENLSPQQIEKIQYDVQYGWMTLKTLVVKTENLTKDEIQKIQNQGETFFLDFLLKNLLKLRYFFN